jgi:hypothetical protein
VHSQNITIYVSFAQVKFTLKKFAMAASFYELLKILLMTVQVFQAAVQARYSNPL